jgi:hypothetical protein
VRRIGPLASFAVALAFLGAPLHARAQVTVTLRHLGGERVGRIVAEDADGVTVESAAAPPAREFIRWDLVRSVSGPGAVPPSRESRLALGESIWRGRVRIDRGDAAAAEPLLEAAASTLSRESGPLALAAWEELLRARIALGGELAEAAVRAPSLRASARTLGDPPVRLPARLDPIDAGTGLVPAAPPAWASRAEATRAREWFRSIAASSRDVALLAGLYAQIAAADAGDPQAPPPRGARPVGSPPPPRGALARGVELLEAWASAVSSDAEGRRRGRETLRRMARELSPAMRAWAIYAAGRSLAMEGDAKQRRIGATEMLKAAAAHGALAPILERAALARAAEALDAAGDAGSAALLTSHAGPPQQYAVTDVLSSPRPALVASEVREREAARVEEEEARALADLLERAGLDDLFALRLEEELARAASPVGASRLCDVLERLFASAADIQRVADLRVRVEHLVARDRLPCVSALRLSAARAEYRLASMGIAALRRGDEPALQGSGTRDDAAMLLAQCVESLDRLEQSLAAELAQLRMRAGGSDEVARTEALAISDLVAAQLLETRYLRAWSQFGLLWLSRGTADPAAITARADQLVPAWASLLETGKAFPSPEDVSVDLRGEEYYASSILGMAVTKALASGMPAADPWFALLREPGVWSATATLEPSMRLDSAIDCGALDAATAQLRDLTVSMSDEAIAGCAMRAMREARGEGSASAGAFARACFESLVERGSLGAAQRLAARVPALARGDGFAPRLAAALAVVVRAKSVQDAERAKPVWEEAARALAAALAAPDAAESPSVPAVRALRGLVLASAGNPCQASIELAAASGQHSGDRADEAAWLAAKLADEGRCVVDGVSTSRDLWLDYLRRFPDGPHANAAMVALARYDEVLDPVLAERLLAVPPDDPVAVEAARAAARIYYRLARSAVGDARADPVRRLFLISPSAAASWPAGWIDPVARQQLEFALDPSASRLELARGLLAEIASRYAPGEEPEPYRAELATRRLEIALLDRRYADAVRELERVRVAGDRAWLTRADALFARDVESMLASEPAADGSDSASRSDAARALVDARRGVLETARRDGNPDRADAASVALARALLAVDAKAHAAEAAALARDVLVRKPSHRASLEVAADAAIAAGQPRVARDALITLMSVLAPTSLERSRRQCQLVEILAVNDPDEARKVLAQHQVFDPTWGPAPWGDRLKAIARSLGMQVQEDERPADGAPGAPSGDPSNAVPQAGGAR